MNSNKLKFSLDISEIVLKSTIDEFNYGIKYSPSIEFKITFNDGAYSSGTYNKDVAKIKRIYSKKLDILKYARGTHTYERVLFFLNSLNIKTVKIYNQSDDSMHVLKILSEKEILENPRNMMGSINNEYPTVFDINSDKLILEAMRFIK